MPSNGKRAPSEKISSTQKVVITKAYALPQARPRRVDRQAKLFLSVLDHFATKCAAIDPGEVPFHRRREQRNVRDFAQMFGDEPDRFVRGHPAQMIESGKIYRARIPAQGPFAAEIEIDIEIAHGQLPQAAVNRLAVTAPGEIRFRHRAPMAADLENRNDMIGVLFGFQIEDKRWKPKDAKRSRGKYSAFET